jgi:HAMP domain-containing protein
MSTKEAIEKIKNMLFSDAAPVVAPAAEPAKFIEVKTKDGLIFEVDKLEVGGSVLLNGAPAADGEYEAEDGTKMKVVSGLITEIMAAEVPAPVEVEVEAMKKLPGMFSAINQDFAATKNEISDLKKTIETQKESLKQMFSLLEKIANNSIEKPIEKVKSFDDMTALEKFRAQK